MKCVFDKIGGYNLRLNATRASRRLYLSLDFQPEKTVYQCQGVARPIRQASGAEARGGVRRLGLQDLSAVVAIDAAGFGVSRAALIGKLLAQSAGYGLFVDGTLCAFALCRPFGRGQVIGPVVAGSDAEAIAVVGPHVADNTGNFLRLDTHMENGDFAVFLAQSGMPVYDTVLTMSMGKRLADFSNVSAAPPATYALASQALG